MPSYEGPYPAQDQPATKVEAVDGKPKVVTDFKATVARNPLPWVIGAIALVALILYTR